MLAPLLEVPSILWADLLVRMRKDGEGIRESGAFLLGALAPTRRVTDFIMYSAVAPEFRHKKYIELAGKHMAKVWGYCEARSLMVVGDVHTHPGVPIQSISDRANPIVSLPGHVALIVPNFAKPVVRLAAIGVHEFHGAGRWNSWFRQDAVQRVLLSEVANEVG